jgi:hypothetical protein
VKLIQETKVSGAQIDPAPQLATIRKLLTSASNAVKRSAACWPISTLAEA